MNQDVMLIARTIWNTVDCEKIYLFGSHAYGMPTPESDYDFYVVVPDGKLRPIEAMRRINGALAKSRMMVPVDVLAGYASQFSAKSVLPTLEGKVAKEGIMLYEHK